MHSKYTVSPLVGLPHSCSDPCSTNLCAAWPDAARACNAQPLQTSVKPLLRPHYPCSQKNIGSVETQAAREQLVADARAARYMQQAASLSSHNHHHSLQLGGPGAMPQEHLVLGDRGKGRPAWCR